MSSDIAISNRLLESLRGRSSIARQLAQSIPPWEAVLTGRLDYEQEVLDLQAV
jgi:hypothetical protein